MYESSTTYPYVGCGGDEDDDDVDDDDVFK